MVWAAVVVALLALILLIVFILQNQQPAKVLFLGLDGTAALGMALFTAAVAALCRWTLAPRVNDGDAYPDAIDRLYFASISHFTPRRLHYGEVLSALTAGAAELTWELADQIHASAKIATFKARCAKWAIRSALATGAMVAVFADTVVSN
jgi:hypothetical protein